MVVIPGQMIQRIITGMPPLDLAVHITGGMRMMTMITIMIVAIVVLIRLLNTNSGRIIILTTRMILHPQMALIGHHAQVEMRLLTCTNPLKQRIGIDTGVNPIIVIGLNPITIGITMGGMPMTVALVAPLTHPAHRVTEVGEVRGIKPK